MNVLKRQAIEDFCQRHADAGIPLTTWYAVCRKAEWNSYHDLQRDYPEAFPVGDNRVMFDIRGNKYRLVARVLFNFKQVQIKWIGKVRYDQCFNHQPILNEALDCHTNK